MRVLVADAVQSPRDLSALPRATAVVSATTAVVQAVFLQDRWPAMKRRTVKIRVEGESWRVPRGFGQAYLRAAEDARKLVDRGEENIVLQSVIDLLSLVGYHATIGQVATWDLRRRVEAMVHASVEHARASDNPIQRHPRPTWLPEHPWQGSWRGDGAFAGPSGTPISTEVA
jgi:hypothetical protein